MSGTYGDDGDDDSRFLEDYTVVGELENLVKQLLNRESSCTFRGTEVLMEENVLTRHGLLDSLDYFSFLDEIPMLFNLPSSCQSYFTIRINPGDQYHYLSIGTAKLLLSAMSLAFPSTPCFVRFGRDSSCIVGKHGQALYSFLQRPVNMARYASIKCCSAMVTLALKMPVKKSWIKCTATEKDVSFPLSIFSAPPVKEYVLRGIYPQTDGKCLVEGLDALLAPILLLSLAEFEPILTQSEVFVVNLNEFCSMAAQPLVFGVNENDVHEKTKMRNASYAVASNLHDTHLSYIFNSSELDISLRLFKSIMACLYDCHNAYSMKSRVSYLSTLWMQFVRLLRALVSERLELDVSEQPNWDEPLVFQKISMLSYCIARLREGNDGEEVSKEATSKGPLSGVFMQNFPDREIQIPVTQPPNPAMTSDLFAQYQSVLQKYPIEERNRLYSLPLLSDMQAFKLVNPGCTLIDFCRWHSPKDIIVNGENSVELSDRMKGGLWSELWEEAEPIALSDQALLFDPKRESEKALFYLEDLSVYELVEQLVASFPRLFNIDQEHAVIKEMLLMDSDQLTDRLVALEEERDRIQRLFRKNVSNLTVDGQMFGFAQHETMLVRRGSSDKIWIASCSNTTSEQ